jgi:hypothetical protein
MEFMTPPKCIVVLSGGYAIPISHLKKWESWNCKPSDKRGIIQWEFFLPLKCCLNHFKAAVIELELVEVGFRKYANLRPYFVADVKVISRL